MTAASRPRDAAATRERLLEAARALFAERGYDRTTLRDVGAGAGVDAALVARYFGNKEALFRSVLASDATPAALEGGARGIAALLTAIWDEHGPGPAVQAIVRTDLDPELRAATGARLRERIVEPFAAQLEAAGVPDARLRAELVLAALVGVGMARAVGGLEALAAAGRDDVLALLGPALEALAPRSFTDA